MKIYAVCRICLYCDFEKQSGKDISIFDKYGESMISEKINALTDVGVKEGDGLPDRICHSCHLDLETAYKFKQKCENTNKILLSAVNNVRTDSQECDRLILKEESSACISDVGDYEDNGVADLSVDDSIIKADVSDKKPNIKTNESDVKSDEADIKPEFEVPQTISRAIDLKLECHDCSGIFKSKCKLRVHWKRVHFSEGLKCSNCLRQFKSIAAMNSHIKMKGKSCATAGKVRIEGEGKNRIFHCKDCSYQSQQIRSMSAHIAIHSGERPYKCDVCTKRFTQRSALDAHKAYIHSVDSTAGTCPYCGKNIQGRLKLYNHVTRQHNQRGFECEICKKMVKSKTSLKNHMEIHSNTTFTCEMCAKSFNTHNALYNHKANVHLKTRVYKCKECKFTSRCYGAISRHRPKHRTANVPCEICGIFLDNKVQLELHMKRHTDRNHKCEHCDKDFFSRKTLLSHVRKKHKLSMLRNQDLAVPVDSSDY